jgi:glutaredoxin
MNKQILALFAIVAALVGFLFLIYTFTSRPAPKTGANLNQQVTTYFYGVSCPNCKVLNEWIKKNGIEKGVKFEKREVYYNKENAAMLEEAALICQIPSDQIGVPLIFNQGKCYVGTPDAQGILNKLLKKG